MTDLPTISKDSAFPIFNNTGRTTIEGSHGLTKREYFAGLAMQGFLSNPQIGGITNLDWAAKTSVQYADALITELNKTK